MGGLMSDRFTLLVESETCRWPIWAILMAGLALSACNRDKEPEPEPADVPGAPGAEVAVFPESSAVAETTTAPPPAPVAPGRPLPEDDLVREAPLGEQREYLLELLGAEHRADAAALRTIRAIFEKSDWLGFGNPKISRGAISRLECHHRRKKGNVISASPDCEAPNMVLVPGGEGTGVCIDQYEFPNVPCEYPVVWVRASEASQICLAMGKRLCDAHEWEGACAGQILPPQEDYAWDRLPAYFERSPKRDRRLTMEHLHNESREVRWAHGEELVTGRCGTAVRKDSRCTTVDWGICPSQTYPAGSFPECVSSVGVYDQHGNVAEHMSLPLRPDGLGGRGDTEMKGSWFAFDFENPHADDCRWRARNWHTTSVDDPNSHRSYHLGFRCCKDLPE
jgi:formylglycine-generating enzyme